MYSSMPMIDVRTVPITMTGAQAGVLAIRAGNPNSSMAPRASNSGHMPPNVVVVAMKRAGMCRRAKVSNMMAVADPVVAVVVGLANGLNMGLNQRCLAS